MSKVTSTLLATFVICALAQSAWAGCVAGGPPSNAGEEIPQCECNPRGNLSTDPDVNDCLGLYGQGYLCLSTGGCCTAPGECGGNGKLVATCNGVCTRAADPGLAAATLCGNGVIDGDEECDPGNTAVDPNVAPAAGICDPASTPPDDPPYCIACRCFYGSCGDE